MKGNKWRTIAIIFIILFVLETIFMIWAINLGIKTVDNEYECSINICNGYDTYMYYNYENICECYTNHKLMIQKYMG